MKNNSHDSKMAMQNLVKRICRLKQEMHAPDMEVKIKGTRFNHMHGKNKSRSYYPR